MKKKLEAHAKEIATNINIDDPDCKLNPNEQFVARGGHVFVSDGKRVLEIPHMVEDIFGSDDYAFANRCLELIETVNDPDLDYTLHKLPPVSELKAEATKLYGKRWSGIIWSDNENWAINARYLIKAMEALNAKVMFQSVTSPRNTPVLLCENDDPQSTTREMIFPIINFRGRTGFWTKEENIS